MELMGALLFVLLAGGATLLLMALIGGGLVVHWRQRGQAGGVARAHGWRACGSDGFEGRLGEARWRGGGHQDDDDGRCWVDFQCGLPNSQGVDFRLFAGPTAGQPPRVDNRDWAAVLTPAVVEAWARAHEGQGFKVRAECRSHFVTVQREFGRTPATLAEIEALMALGEALSAATLALLPRAR
jgi:hypothetical protein